MAPRRPGASTAIALTGQLTLILENGDMVRDDGIQPSGALYYKEYAWPMPMKGADDYGARGRDEREMTFGELLGGGVPGVVTQSNKDKERAELQARLVQALSLPLFRHRRPAPRPDRHRAQRPRLGHHRRHRAVHLV